MLTFVEYVQNRLDEIDWTGHDLAHALGYRSAGLVYQVLAGDLKPPLKKVDAWAKALRLEPEEAVRLRMLAEREHTPLGMRARMIRLEEQAARFDASLKAKDQLIAELKIEIQRLRERRGGSPSGG